MTFLYYAAGDAVRTLRLIVSSRVAQRGSHRLAVFNEQEGEIARALFIDSADGDESRRMLQSL